MRITNLLKNGALPLMADGAFGTYFRGLTHSDAPCETANISEPQLVADIHKSYVRAGARVIYTNTFAANSRQIADETRLQTVIEAGVALARQAAGNEAAVLADIGDCGLNDEEQAIAEYLKLTRMFLNAGARDFVFETMSGFSALEPALAYIRGEAADAFILVTFAVAQDGYSKRGLFYQDLLDKALASPNVSASGLNCVCGPGHMTRLLAAYPFKGRRIVAKPNAGYPAQVNQRLVYEDNQDYYAARLAELAAMGCFMVGGCCGTAPGHIAKACKALGAPRGSSAQGFALPAKEETTRSGKEDAVLPPPSLVVELNPPISRDISHFMKAARAAQAAGAQMISITDSPLARARADSLMLSAKLRRELGIEVLPHLSCRDRNRLGLKSALLAAAIENIRYVLAVRGDTAEDAVFSLNSKELIGFINSLNRELLAPEGFCCGGALNINAANFAAELKRAQAKEAVGCAFFLTQPVCDEQGIANAALAAKTLKTPVLAGILPVAGYKNALFLQQEVGGIHIPDALIQQLYEAGPKGAREVSLAHCRAMMRRLKPLCGGFYLMTPLDRIEWVCELVAEARS